MQDPDVQELIPGWKDKGRAEGPIEAWFEDWTEGWTEGRLEEAKQNLHQVLAARDLPVTPDVRARIYGERDVARLEAWLEAAVTAPTIGEIFRDE